MRSRQEIKAYAKQAFAAQRSSCIIAVFLVMLIAIGINIISIVIEFITLFFGIAGYQALAIITSASFAFVMFVLTIAITFFILVLQVNLNGTMVKAFYGYPIISTEPYTALKVNFGRKLGGMCWQFLWVYLWTLVGVVSLFIPTIIKYLSYSMAPYILADNPNVTATNALTLSKRMTKGHRGEIFVMGLSFLGWQLLDFMTLGILGIFYVNPYMRLSYAGLFIELRNHAVATGAIHPSELDGYQPQYIAYPQYPPAPPYEHPAQYPHVPPPIPPYEHHAQYPHIPPQYPPMPPPQYPPPPDGDEN